MPSSRVGLLLALLLLAALHATYASATYELLRNGGFEQGTSAWSGAGLSSGGCAPHGGSGALQITSTGDRSGFAQQRIPGPLGDGDYTFSGAISATSGAPAIEVTLTWLDKAGSALASSSTGVAGIASYAPFSIDSSLPPGAEDIRVAISVEGGPSNVCLDSLGLDGPAPPDPTPSPTPTTPPSPTPTATFTPGPTASPTATPRPTNTPAPTQTTQPSPTATIVNLSQAEAMVATPTATPTPESDATLTETPAAPTSLALAAAPSPEGGAAAPRSPAAPRPGREVHAVLSSGPPDQQQIPLASAQSTSNDDGVPAVWLVAGALFVAGLGGSYLMQRHRG